MSFQGTTPAQIRRCAFTAFAESLKARHSRNSHHPFPMGEWFRGYTGSLLRYGLSSCSPPCTDLTRDFPSQLGLLLPGFR